MSGPTSGLRRCLFVALLLTYLALLLAYATPSHPFPQSTTPNSLFNLHRDSPSASLIDSTDNFDLLEAPSSSTEDPEELSSDPEDYDRVIRLTHFFPHSHTDAGWLRSYASYHTSTVRSILESVINSLLQHPDRRFVWVDMLYFSTYYFECSPQQRARVDYLIKSNQLDLANGAMTMNDVAVVKSDSFFHDFHHGLQFIYQQFGKKVQYGWSIDPFGVSASEIALWAQMGYKWVVFQRNQDQLKQSMSGMESQTAGTQFVWKPHSKMIGDAGSLFAEFWHEYYVGHWEMDKSWSDMPREGKVNVEVWNFILFGYGDAGDLANFTNMLMDEVELDDMGLTYNDRLRLGLENSSNSSQTGPIAESDEEYRAKRGQHGKKYVQVLTEVIQRVTMLTDDHSIDLGINVSDLESLLDYVTILREGFKTGSTTSKRDSKGNPITVKTAYELAHSIKEHHFNIRPIIPRSFSLSSLSPPLQNQFISSFNTRFQQLIFTTISLTKSTSTLFHVSTPFGADFSHQNSYLTQYGMDFFCDYINNIQHYPVPTAMLRSNGPSFDTSPSNNGNPFEKAPRKNQNGVRKCHTFADFINISKASDFDLFLCIHDKYGLIVRVQAPQLWKSVEVVGSDQSVQENTLSARRKRSKPKKLQDTESTVENPTLSEHGEGGDTTQRRPFRVALQYPWVEYVAKFRQSTNDEYFTAIQHEVQQSWINHNDETAFHRFHGAPTRDNAQNAQDTTITQQPLTIQSDSTETDLIASESTLYPSQLSSTISMHFQNDLATSIIPQSYFPFTLSPFHSPTQSHHEAITLDHFFALPAAQIADYNTLSSSASNPTAKKSLQLQQYRKYSTPRSRFPLISTPTTRNVVFQPFWMSRRIPSSISFSNRSTTPPFYQYALPSTPKALVSASTSIPTHPITFPTFGPSSLFPMMDNWWGASDQRWWGGYYTSRSWIKQAERSVQSSVQALDQLASFAGSMDWTVPVHTFPQFNLQSDGKKEDGPVSTPQTSPNLELAYIDNGRYIFGDLFFHSSMLTNDTTRRQHIELSQMLPFYSKSELKFIQDSMVLYGCTSCNEFDLTPSIFVTSITKRSHPKAVNEFNLARKENTPVLFKSGGPNSVMQFVTDFISNTMGADGLKSFMPMGYPGISTTTNTTVVNAQWNPMGTEQLSSFQPQAQTRTRTRTRTQTTLTTTSQCAALTPFEQSHLGIIRQILSMLQHHDAITATSPLTTMQDYYMQVVRASESIDNLFSLYVSDLLSLPRYTAGSTEQFLNELSSIVKEVKGNYGSSLTNSADIGDQVLKIMNETTSSRQINSQSTLSQSILDEIFGSTLLIDTRHTTSHQETLFSEITGEKPSSNSSGHQNTSSVRLLWSQPGSQSLVGSKCVYNRETKRSTLQPTLIPVVLYNPTSTEISDYILKISNITSSDVVLLDATAKPIYSELVSVLFDGVETNSKAAQTARPPSGWSYPTTTQTREHVLSSDHYVGRLYGAEEVLLPPLPLLSSHDLLNTFPQTLLQDVQAKGQSDPSTFGHLFNLTQLQNDREELRTFSSYASRSKKYQGYFNTFQQLKLQPGQFSTTPSKRALDQIWTELSSDFTTLSKMRSMSQPSFSTLQCPLVQSEFFATLTHHAQFYDIPAFIALHTAFTTWEPARAAQLYKDVGKEVDMSVIGNLTFTQPQQYHQAASTINTYFPYLIPKYNLYSAPISLKPMELKVVWMAVNTKQGPCCQAVSDYHVEPGLYTYQPRSPTKPQTAPAIPLIHRFKLNNTQPGDQLMLNSTSTSQMCHFGVGGGMGLDQYCNLKSPFDPTWHAPVLLALPWNEHFVHPVTSMYESTSQTPSSARPLEDQSTLVTAGVCQQAISNGRTTLTMSGGCGYSLDNTNIPIYSIGATTSLLIQQSNIKHITSPYHLSLTEQDKTTFNPLNTTYNHSNLHDFYRFYPNAFLSGTNSTQHIDAPRPSPYSVPIMTPISIHFIKEQAEGANQGHYTYTNGNFGVQQFPLLFNDIFNEAVIKASAPFPAQATDSRNGLDVLNASPNLPSDFMSMVNLVTNRSDLVELDFKSLLASIPVKKLQTLSQQFVITSYSTCNLFTPFDLSTPFFQQSITNVVNEFYNQSTDASLHSIQSNPSPNYSTSPTFQFAINNYNSVYRYGDASPHPRHAIGAFPLPHTQSISLNLQPQQFITALDVLKKPAGFRPQNRDSFEHEHELTLEELNASTFSTQQLQTSKPQSKSQTNSATATNQNSKAAETNTDNIFHAPGVRSLVIKGMVLEMISMRTWDHDKPPRIPQSSLQNQLTAIQLWLEHTRGHRVDPVINEIADDVCHCGQFSPVMNNLLYSSSPLSGQFLFPECPCFIDTHSSEPVNGQNRSDFSQVDKFPRSIDLSSLKPLNLDPNSIPPFFPTNGKRFHNRWTNSQYGSDFDKKLPAIAQRTLAFIKALRIFRPSDGVDLSTVINMGLNEPLNLSLRVQSGVENSLSIDSSRQSDSYRHTIYVDDLGYNLVQKLYSRVNRCHGNHFPFVTQVGIKDEYPELVSVPSLSQLSPNQIALVSNLFEESNPGFASLAGGDSTLKRVKKIIYDPVQYSTSVPRGYEYVPNHVLQTLIASVNDSGTPSFRYPNTHLYGVRQMMFFSTRGGGVTASAQGTFDIMIGRFLQNSDALGVSESLRDTNTVSFKGFLTFQTNSISRDNTQVKSNQLAEVQNHNAVDLRKIEAQMVQRHHIQHILEFFITSIADRLTGEGKPTQLNKERAEVIAFLTSTLLSTSSLNYADFGVDWDSAEEVALFEQKKKLFAHEFAMFDDVLGSNINSIYSWLFDSASRTHPQQNTYSHPILSHLTSTPSKLVRVMKQLQYLDRSNSTATILAQIKAIDRAIPSQYQLPLSRIGTGLIGVGIRGMLYNPTPFSYTASYRDYYTSKKRPLLNSMVSEYLTSFLPSFPSHDEINYDKFVDFVKGSAVRVGGHFSFLEHHILPGDVHYTSTLCNSVDKRDFALGFTLYKDKNVKNRESRVQIPTTEQFFPFLPQLRATNNQDVSFASARFQPAVLTTIFGEWTKLMTVNTTTSFNPRALGIGTTESAGLQDQLTERFETSPQYQLSTLDATNSAHIHHLASLLSASHDVERLGLTDAEMIELSTLLIKQTTPSSSFSGLGMDGNNTTKLDRDTLFYNPSVLAPHEQKTQLYHYSSPMHLASDAAPILGYSPPTTFSQFHFQADISTQTSAALSLLTAAVNQNRNRPGSSNYINMFPYSPSQMQFLQHLSKLKLVENNPSSTLLSDLFNLDDLSLNSKTVDAILKQNMHFRVDTTDSSPKTISSYILDTISKFFYFQYGSEFYPDSVDPIYRRLGFTYDTRLNLDSMTSLLKGKSNSARFSTRNCLNAHLDFGQFRFICENYNAIDRVVNEFDHGKSPDKSTILHAIPFFKPRSVAQQHILYLSQLKYLGNVNQLQVVSTFHESFTSTFAFSKMLPDQFSPLGLIKLTGFDEDDLIDGLTSALFSPNAYFMGTLSGASFNPVSTQPSLCTEDNFRSYVHLYSNPILQFQSHPVPIKLDPAEQINHVSLRIIYTAVAETGLNSMKATIRDVHKPIFHGVTPTWSDTVNYQHFSYSYLPSHNNTSTSTLPIIAPKTSFAPHLTTKVQTQPAQHSAQSTDQCTIIQAIAPQCSTHAPDYFRASMQPNGQADAVIYYDISPPKIVQTVGEGGESNTYSFPSPSTAALPIQFTTQSLKSNTLYTTTMSNKRIQGVQRPVPLMGYGLQSSRHHFDNSIILHFIHQNIYTQLQGICLLDDSQGNIDVILREMVSQQAHFHPYSHSTRSLLTGQYDGISPMSSPAYLAMMKQYRDRLCLPHTASIPSFDMIVSTLYDNSNIVQFWNPDGSLQPFSRSLDAYSLNIYDILLKTYRSLYPASFASTFGQTVRELQQKPFVLHFDPKTTSVLAPYTSVPITYIAGTAIPLKTSPDQIRSVVPALINDLVRKHRASPQTNAQAALSDATQRCIDEHPLQTTPHPSTTASSNFHNARIICPSMPQYQTAQSVNFVGQQAETHFAPRLLSDLHLFNAHHKSYHEPLSVDGGVNARDSVLLTIPMNSLLYRTSGLNSIPSHPDSLQLKFTTFEQCTNALHMISLSINPSGDIIQLKSSLGQSILSTLATKKGGVHGQTIFSNTNQTVALTTLLGEWITSTFATFNPSQTDMSGFNAGTSVLAVDMVAMTKSDHLLNTVYNSKIDRLSYNPFCYCSSIGHDSISTHRTTLQQQQLSQHPANTPQTEPIFQTISSNHKNDPKLNTSIIFFQNPLTNEFHPQFDTYLIPVSPHSTLNFEQSLFIKSRPFQYQSFQTVLYTNSIYQNALHLSQLNGKDVAMMEYLLSLDQPSDQLTPVLLPTCTSKSQFVSSTKPSVSQRVDPTTKKSHKVISPLFPVFTSSITTQQSSSSSQAQQIGPQEHPLQQTIAMSLFDTPINSFVSHHTTFANINGIAQFNPNLLSVSENVLIETEPQRSNSLLLIDQTSNWNFDFETFDWNDDVWSDRSRFGPEDDTETSPTSTSTPTDQLPSPNPSVIVIILLAAVLFIFNCYRMWKNGKCARKQQKYHSLSFGDNDPDQPAGYSHYGRRGVGTERGGYISTEADSDIDIDIDIHLDLAEQPHQYSVSTTTFNGSTPSPEKSLKTKNLSTDDRDENNIDRFEGYQGNSTLSQVQQRAGDELGDASDVDTVPGFNSLL